MWTARLGPMNDRAHQNVGQTKVGTTGSCHLKLGLRNRSQLPTMVVVNLRVLRQELRQQSRKGREVKDSAQ